MATVKNPNDIVKKEDNGNIKLKLKKITDFKQIKLMPVKLKLDIFTLESILAFLYKDSALKTNKVLKNFFKLFSNIDEAYYKENPNLYARFWIIQNTLRLLVDERYENYNSVKADLMESSESNELICSIIQDLDSYKIGYEESKKLITKIDDRLRFGYVITIKDVIESILDSIDTDSYNSYKAVSDDLYAIANSILNIHRNTNSLDYDQTFSLDTDLFEEIVTSAVEKMQDRMRMLKTGIQGLNVFLAPAYLSKRLYMYLAFPGGGKSQVLLLSALDIKRYNSHVKAKDPKKNPAVLMITMENSIEETVERIFNMEVSSDDIRNYTPKQVIKKLREGAELTLTDENNIDIIIKYYPNRSIDTNDLYGIINDLNDDGNEVIALVLDYVKRIRPAERAMSEKEELKNITNELKNLATYYDIPVITAQQLNRVAASVVDAAIQAKKEDVTKLVGREGVAGAWEIVENSDFVCILNQEVKAETGELFMTFKLLKRRYRSSDENEQMRRLEYFNQPYEPGNEIHILRDVHLSKPLMVYSLGEGAVSLEDVKRGRKNAIQRGNSNDNSSLQNNYFEDFQLEFDPFDVETSKNY